MRPAGRRTEGGTITTPWLTAEKTQPQGRPLAPDRAVLRGRREPDPVGSRRDVLQHVHRRHALLGGAERNAVRLLAWPARRLRDDGGDDAGRQRGHADPRRRARHPRRSGQRRDSGQGPGGDHRDGADTFTATLTFHLCGPFAAGSTDLCGTGGVLVDTQNLTTDGIYTSAAATVTSAGRYCWRADFSGDEDAGVPPGSDSAASECFIVNPRQSALTTQAGEARSHSASRSRTRPH